MTDQNPDPLPEELRALDEHARRLQEQAERDDILPEEGEVSENGVGPQTGVVP